MTGIAAILNSNYFSLSENWGAPEKVSASLIMEADRYRGILGSPIHISPVEGAVYAESGHEDLSWHKIIPGRNSLCMAMDIFPECDLAYAWLTAIKMEKLKGIGIYPFAIYPTKGLIGMLHIDTRFSNDKILWWRDDKNEYHYLIDSKDIRKLMAIILIR